jgi:hypothetical protein
MMPSQKLGNESPKKLAGVRMRSSQGMRATGREDAGRDGDGEGQEQGEHAQLKRGGQPLGDVIQHRLPVAERPAEVPARRRGDPAHVLDGQRLVEAEVPPDVGDRRGVEILARVERLGSPGEHVHRSEQEERDGEQHRDHDEDALQGIPRPGRAHSFRLS